MTITYLHKLDKLDPRVHHWDPFPTERRGCPFCGEYSAPLFLRPDDLPVSQCSRCRCFYVSLRIADEVLRQFYDSYWSATCPRPLTDEMARYLLSSAGNRASSDVCIRKLTALRGGWNGAQVLDLGCGFGEKATMMRALGASVTGLDISAAAVKFMTDQLEMEAYGSTIEEWAGKKSFFDIVTMFEFVEHLLDPYGSLMAVVDKIRTGGLLVIVTPNGTAGDRAAFPLHGEWIGFRVDLEHMQYLHVDTIDYLAHKLDCRILHCEQMGFRALDDVARCGRETTRISSRRIRRFIKAIPGVRSAVYAFRNLQMRRRAAARPPLDTGVYHLFAVLQKTGVRKGNVA